MKKKTQKQILLNLLRSQPDKWFPSFEIQSVDTEFGWLGTSADRQARQMAENGLIDREQRGKYAYYRAKAPVRVERMRIVDTGEIIERKIWE